MTTIGSTSPDEREVMRSLQEGSPKALATIYERIAPVLYPLALRIVGTRERACAVIEDLFEEIWRDRAKVCTAAGIPRVEWTARCRELAIAQMGVVPPSEPKRAAVAAMPPATAPPATGSATDPSPGAVDPRVAARQALASLPERDRRALEEAYFRGTAAREIATLLGAPTSDAEAMVRAALVRFRDRVDEGDGVDVEMERAS